MNACSSWIWPEKETAADQYAEFVDTFTVQTGAVRLLISADSNYAVYLNGQYVFSGQYADFPHYKVYDELDLSPYCVKDENRLAIVVWYYGQGNMGYYPGRAALRYEVWQDDRLCAASAETTLSRLSLSYVNGLRKSITGQLGFSFKYDLTQEDEWLHGKLHGFHASTVVHQQLPVYKRPVKRPVIGEPAPFSVLCNENGTHWLVDLGREEVGFLAVRAVSDVAQDVLITYGEHLADGQVRRMIDSRDFSVELKLRKGLNEYINPFRRLGLRYLELFAAEKIDLQLLSVCPVHYPLEVKQLPFAMDELQKRIYDTCIRTLALCMHEHYEDTPWREQALYAMDSRNQMLCGYDAFGEFAFARANLLLMSKDERADGLLSICTPSSDDLTIPSFSLHYFTAVYEYTVRSRDLTLIREIWPKLTSLLEAFTSRIEEDCIPVFLKRCHWNFYEWAQGMSGRLHQQENKRFDAALNCLLSMALQAMQNMADLLGVKAAYGETAKRINGAINSRFFCTERGLYRNSTEDAGASVLVNSLAILCGAAPDAVQTELAAKLAEPDGSMTPSSLSMIGFMYDALLNVDEQKYRQTVLDDIARKYQKMLDAGATTFWETETGQSDFDNAGSLCHGWSAMPVHYYHRLLK